MRPELKRRGLSVVLVCVMVLGAGASLGTEDLMKKLPVYERFRCAICHNASTPDLGSHDLNDFGRAFHDNGDKWDPTLAALDSDNDGYTNGTEIGDEDGDGSPSVSRERSNPGNPLETPSSLDPQTWGVIKRLFED